MVEHQLPKLTVRVRFPSPAPYTKTVARQADWLVSPRWSQPLAALETGLRAINVPLAHVADNPGTVLILIRAVVI
jgi:hypothetical protein